MMAQADFKNANYEERQKSPLELVRQIRRTRELPLPFLRSPFGFSRRPKIAANRSRWPQRFRRMLCPGPQALMNPSTIDPARSIGVSAIAVALAELRSVFHLAWARASTFLYRAY